MKYKVSILVPVYNQEHLINKCLNSIPDRTDIEVIVCDDGSTDNTYKILQKRKNIKLYKNRTNKGVAYTLNKLIDKAMGDYIYLLGSDDFLYTENFGKAIDKLDGTDFIFCQTSNNYGMVELNEHNKCGSFKFMRKDFIKDFRYDDFRLAGEDYYLWNKMLQRKPTIKYLDLMIKHYNYPRVDSLNWQLNQGIIDLKTGLKRS